jgi:hypothetical protein
LIPILFPKRVGECVAYFELAVGFGQSVGANSAYLIKSILESNFLMFIFFGVFYFFFTYPVLKILPPDTNDEDTKPNPLSYMDFIKIPRFFATNLSMVATLTANMFLLTGIVYGIEDFPGYEDHMVKLIGVYTAVYGVLMYILS